MTDTAHTPTPWIAGTGWIGDEKNHRTICADFPGIYRDGGTAEANQKFIVRAVNSHEALVEALERSLSAHISTGAALRSLAEQQAMSDDWWIPIHTEVIASADAAREALALARGGAE